MTKCKLWDVERPTKTHSGVFSSNSHNSNLFNSQWEDFRPRFSQSRTLRRKRLTNQRTHLVWCNLFHPKAKFMAGLAQICKFKRWLWTQICTIKGNKRSLKGLDLLGPMSKLAPLSLMSWSTQTTIKRNLKCVKKQGRSPNINLYSS